MNVVTEPSPNMSRMRLDLDLTDDGSIEVLARAFAAMAPDTEQPKRKGVETAQAMAQALSEISQALGNPERKEGSDHWWSDIPDAVKVVALDAESERYRADQLSAALRAIAPNGTALSEEDAMQTAQSHSREQAAQLSAIRKALRLAPDADLMHAVGEHIASTGILEEVSALVGFVPGRGSLTQTIKHLVECAKSGPVKKERKAKVEAIPSSPVEVNGVIEPGPVKVSPQPSLPVSGEMPTVGAAQRLGSWRPDDWEAKAGDWFVFHDPSLDVLDVGVVDEVASMGGTIHVAASVRFDKDGPCNRRSTYCEDLISPWPEGLSPQSFILSGCANPFHARPLQDGRPETPVRQVPDAFLRLPPARFETGEPVTVLLNSDRDASGYAVHSGTILKVLPDERFEVEVLMFNDIEVKRVIDGDRIRARGEVAA